jgi:DNA-binding CsgD family transcriptional regulator
MKSLEITDVDRITGILAQAFDPTRIANLIERKRDLIEEVADWLDIDVYIWTTSAANPSKPGDVITTCMIDGGWRDGRQQAMAFEALTSEALSAWQKPFLDAISAGQYLTTTRQEMISDEQWATAGADWRRTGLEHMLIVVYPLSKSSFSAIGLHRVSDKPDFSPREKTIVGTIFKQIDWLHRHGENEAAKPQVMGLTPRLRQVLTLLLAGDAKKHIASKLAISEHTVGDYVKDIYRHFAVNSRGELQAYFLTAKNAG